MKKQQNYLFNSQCNGKVDSMFSFFSCHSHLILLFVVPFSIFNLNTSLNIHIFKFLMINMDNEGSV